MEHVFLLLRILICLGLFILVANQTCDDGDYTLLSDPRRSVQSVYDSAISSALCDSAIPEDIWFRFLSYTGDAVVERAANDSVPELHCGTQGPIYIRGIDSHPSNNFTTTTATVCANYGGDPCQWTETIQIYKCPDYYLYKLKSPPGCAISYCVGEGSMCNNGDYWNGHSCVNSFPPMRGFPVFSGPHMNGSGFGKEVYFSCEVQYDRQPDDADARFRVTFLFDGQPLEYIGVNTSKPEPERLQPTILNPDSGLVALIGEFYLRGRLGREISCQVESFWNGGSNTSSSLMSVGKYYAAFESTVKSYSISLTNGSTFDVPFQSTLPLTCKHCKDQGCCKYEFRLLDYNASSIQCFLRWTGNVTAAVTVYFVPGATQTKDSFALVFEKYNDDEVSALGRSLFRNYLIPTVKMIILPVSAPYKHCQSISDPHLVTFDSIAFNNQKVGDFYLVKAINVNQLMEIQVRQELCNYGKAACNCGVVVREGNSAFKISICEAGSWSRTDQRSPTVVRLLSQDPEDSSAIFIDGTGLIFSVRMPSGLRVEVDLRKPWFNVQVYLPPEYHGKTDSSSMCGNSNGNRNDDSTSDLEKFRIPKDLSYFQRQPECSAIFNTPATRCGCNDTKPTIPTCSNKDPTLKRISMPDKPFSGQWTTGVICSPTTVSAVSSLLYDKKNNENDFILDDDILFPPYTYDPHFGENVSFAWPTPTGKTEQQVERYCSGILESSPAYADCNTTVDLTIGLLIAMCVSDIQIADDWISVDAFANVFEQSCLNKMAASLNSSDADGSNVTFDSLASVSGKLCPNRCNGRGTCSEGACICNTGYIGADCSIDQAQPPSLTSMTRNGACDVRTRPCDVISVFGSGVAFSSALKCRFTDQNTGAHVETQGTFITAGEYSCPVPETTTHRRRRSVASRTTAMSAKTVSITIDGVLYSNALDFVLYDSVCMECSNSATCRQTSNGCLISGECFADGTVNPDNFCSKCVPNVNRNTWMDVTVVENWSTCTRNCDTGVETRNTVCGTRITNKEIAFCKELNCPGNAEQETQGFGITLSTEDLKQILIDPDKSLVPFSDAINQYCAKNAAACCSSIGLKTSASAVAYSSSDLLSYASGYPIIDSTSDPSLKIIVKIDHGKLAAECSQSRTQRSSIIVYADSKLIFDALNSEKSAVEQALSIKIKSVWISKSSQSSAPGNCISLSIINSLVAFWLFFVLVWSNFA